MDCGQLAMMLTGLVLVPTPPLPPRGARKRNSDRGRWGWVNDLVGNGSRDREHRGEKLSLQDLYPLSPPQIVPSAGGRWGGCGIRRQWISTPVGKLSLQVLYPLRRSPGEWKSHSYHSDRPASRNPSASLTRSSGRLRGKKNCKLDAWVEGSS
jgi:hypothetical protein